MSQSAAWVLLPLLPLSDAVARSHFSAASCHAVALLSTAAAARLPPSLESPAPLSVADHERPSCILGLAAEPCGELTAALVLVLEPALGSVLLAGTLKSRSCRGLPASRGKREAASCATSLLKPPGSCCSAVGAPGCSAACSWVTTSRSLSPCRSGFRALVCSPLGLRALAGCYPRGLLEANTGQCRPLTDHSEQTCCVFYAKIKITCLQEIRS